MATQIQIKRGSTTPAGLTVGESAMNTSTNQIYLGGTGGTVLVGGEVTGGVDMGAGSAVSANRIPTQSGVYNYVRNSTVTLFNGATGAVTGASLGANTFTALNTFNAGISAAGGVTLAGTFSGATGSFSRLLTASAGISASGATFSGNISAPNIVTFVNGATGSVTTYAGTTGNIQVRYGSGIIATNYFGLSSRSVGQITDVLTLSGETVGFAANSVGNNEALGLEFDRGFGGFDLDEGGGVAISAKGIYDEGGPYLYGASLYLTTPESVDSGGVIYFKAGGGDQFQISPVSIHSSSVHYFENGINSVASGYTNNFAGLITGVTATFTGLLSATKGISAAGGVTFSGTLKGVTANFTGLVSSTVGFSGSGTNITGLVSSFNGLTGAVTGVSRVNGFTGGITFAASTGITFTASAGTITLSTTGGGGSKTYAVYTPLDNQPPAANYATIDTRNSIMVLDFDAATDESAVFVGIIPEAASLGSGLKIRINWMATSATSGTCRWGVQIERMNTDEDSDSFDTAATAGSTTNATSGIITTTEITITTIDSVAAGDPFRIKVFRDADGTSGTDDMTGDAELVSVEVRSAA